MSEWTKQRLDQMIADGVEENLSLDYKRADSLAATDGKKIEITKDVSSFANSSGGILIYGIAEFDDKPRRHLPDRLDPILRSQISKEWLDQVIQTIQPRIEGVVIHPITISEPDNAVCYVVEVPQSHTAHMARDHRYHKRHNFTTACMEDYEVRDVMNRRTNPKIRGYIYVNRDFDHLRSKGMVTVRLENVGRVMARDVMVDVELPIDMNGLIAVDGPAWRKKTADGYCEYFRLTPGEGDGLLFPGADIFLRRTLNTGVQWKSADGISPSSSRYVRVGIFADEMPPVRATLDIANVLSGMTPVQGAESQQQTPP